MMKFLFQAKLRRKTRRPGPAAGAAICLIVTVTAGPVRAENAAPTVTPELTARVAAFFKKVDLLRRPRLDQRMAREIEEITETTGLGPEGVKVLRAAATQAEDAAQAEQLANQTKAKPAEYVEQGQEAIDTFDQPEGLPVIAESPETIAYTPAFEQPAWKAGLARALTPAQADAWEKTRAARDDAAHKEVDTFLSGMLGRYRPGRAQPILNASHEIAATLDLPKERADALNALAEKAVDVSMDRWRQSAARALLNQSAAQRKEVIKSQRFYTPYAAEDDPEKLPAWKEGVARLLTDEDRARLQTARENHRTRHIHALGQLLVTLLDAKVALTSGQRPRLEPIAERLVQTRKEFFPEPGASINYNTYSPANFYEVAAGAKPEELQPILDEIQSKRWQTAKDKKPGADDDETDTATAPQPTPTPDPDTPGEPEDVEQTVSNYLAFQTTLHRREFEDGMILRAEDAKRVAELTAEQAARLQTAARGAAEAESQAWLSNVEQTVRPVVQQANRENIQARLGTVSSYYFRQNTDAAEDGRWDATVKTEMTAAQQKAWQAERDARDQYRDEAAGQFLMEEFDREVGLGAEQREKVRPLVVKSFHDYQADVASMFSYSNAIPWYLSSYYMFLPIHGIPEEDMKAILTKEQWDRWTESVDFTNTTSYWENVKENHERRVKAEKEKAEKEKKDKKS